MSLLRCPSCDGSELPLFLTAAAVESELEARRRFFFDRLGLSFPAAGLKDITDLALGNAAAIFRCSRCGVLVRDTAADGETSFRDDGYDRRTLEEIHRAHVAAFRRRKAWLEALEPGSRVIEIGSYAGGFARVAAENGLDIVCVDIGGATARFTRALGFPTLQTPFEECDLAEESADGVFVWNCFEQLDSPRSALAGIARVLRKRGRLVLRVPDARLYAALRERPPEAALPLLAYNSFLGWPHRFGFDLSGLRHLCEERDLRFVTARRSRAMRPHRAAMHPWARAEESAALADLAERGWLEVMFEKAA